MNTMDITADALEDLQSFIRDYVNTQRMHPDYSDVHRIIRVLERVSYQLKTAAFEVSSE
jgi:hypothetical protein